jgi:hypothetical protein
MPAISAIDKTGVLSQEIVGFEKEQYALDDLTEFAPPAGCVRFLQTDLYSPEDCNIEILANSVAPIKAYLNGQIIIDKKHRSAGILPTWHLQNISIHLLPRDMGFAKLSIKKGWNTVLLRLDGADYPQDINFHLIRILTAKIEDAGFSDYRPELKITNTYWKE